MSEVLWVSIAGVLGTLSRYGLTGLVYRVMDKEQFPYGTLLVNVLGSFAIGIIMQLGIATTIIPRTARVAATIGFLGAFTTFSTFSYETVKLMENRMWGNALLNAGANVIGCCIACWLGISLAKALTGGR